jgi:hypothetical protein
MAATVTCALGLMPAATTAHITIVAHVTAARRSKLSDTEAVSATTDDTNPATTPRPPRSK